MNKLFLTAITGECCLYALHGIKPPGYNPFVMLRKQLANHGVIIKGRTHLPLLLEVKRIYEDNNMDYHRLLLKTIEELQERKNDQVVEDQMGIS